MRTLTKGQSRQEREWENPLGPSDTDHWLRQGSLWTFMSRLLVHTTPYWVHMNSFYSRFSQPFFSNLGPTSNPHATKLTIILSSFAILETQSKETFSYNLTVFPPWETIASLLTGRSPFSGLEGDLITQWPMGGSSQCLSLPYTPPKARKYRQYPFPSSTLRDVEVEVLRWLDFSPDYLPVPYSESKVPPEAPTLFPELWLPGTCLSSLPSFRNQSQEFSTS